ncbi:MAG TPA: hypothetical protein PL070_00560, partial [Flavobacteriales bacterium]|nr:hypothetical protein [Flavobacteriales bacterium]
MLPSTTTDQENVHPEKAFDTKERPAVVERGKLFSTNEQRRIPLRNTALPELAVAYQWWCGTATRLML